MGESFLGSETLCIVVPCYNEEESLGAFRDALEEVEGSLTEYLAKPIDFVFVDDGSGDRTLAILREFHRLSSRYHYVSFSRNFGKEAGLLAGLQQAEKLGSTCVAVMDVDLQDPPALLPKMFARMAETDCDVVATYRESREGEPPVRSWFAHRFYGLMNRISDVEMRDGARDFRLMRQRVVRAILSLPERERFSKGLFAWVGFDTEWIGYKNIEREHGETHWSFWSLVKYAMSGVIDFSKVPLEGISIAGLVVFLLSLVFLVFIVVRAAIFGDPVAGWPSLVCIVTLLCGLQLLGIGVIGLYLSRIYSEVKARPAYVAKEEA